MTELDKGFGMIKIVFEKLAKEVFHLVEGFKDAVGELFSEFFKEAFHRVEFGTGTRQLFKGNAPLLADAFLVGACAISNQHNRVVSVQFSCLCFEMPDKEVEGSLGHVR